MVHGFILRYQRSFEIATFSIILLPLRNIYLSYVSQALIICCTLEIQDENIVIINLPEV
jgi:hypothetical protein